MQIYISVLLFIFGLVFGSFYHVVGDRLSNNKSIIKPRSHCDNCNHELRWYELIPIVSYIIQKGKCRICKIKLPISYLLIELLTGVLFLISYLLFDLSLEMIICIIISSLVVIIFVSDFKYLIIPDSPIYIATLLVIILNFAFKDLSTGFNVIFSSLIMFTFMYIVKLVGDNAFKRESLGGGDIKLSLFIGSVLKIPLPFVSIVIASFITLPYALYYLIKKKEKEVPFGPFLILATLLTFIFQNQIMSFLNYLFNI